MSSKIKILPDHVINKIAAGEVVERPASVVKELVENSIDAGATEVFIDIEQAGRRLIRITDNGSGMSKDDARTAFERHATSKITSDKDLEAVRTMGFRGEALSSIAAVSQVRLLTAERGAPSGVLMEREGGVLKTASDAAAAQGTSLEITHLFYNMPARLKFLKSPGTEFSHILIAVSRQAMAHPSIRFSLTHSKKSVLDLPSSQNVKERALQVYGSEIAENLFAFSGGRDGVLLHGLLSRPAYTRADRTYQDFYVNLRPVKNPTLTHALYGAYGDMLMRERHPLGFIFIELDPSLVDVNVHPAKAEVRFRNQSQIHDLVRDTLREGLRSAGMPVSSARDERVREAASEYLSNAECGVRNAEYKSESKAIPSSSLFSHPNMLPIEGSHNSAFRIPHSELLYPLAQVHDSFIIAQSEEGMTIIDQHAAHERVLFEKLQDQFGSGRVSVQNMLLPLQVELGAAQGSLLSEHLPELDRLGFIVEDFGNGAFVIKGVPALLVSADYRKLLLDVLDEVNIHGKSRKMEELRDDILSVMACHPAIKINRKLDGREMTGLIADLFHCRMPHTCPHGRPTMVQFTMHEIKKMFKRV